LPLIIGIENKLHKNFVMIEENKFVGLIDGFFNCERKIFPIYLSLGLNN